MIITGIAARLSAGVTCFAARCSTAVNQRQIVAGSQTREKSGIAFAIDFSKREDHVVSGSHYPVCNTGNRVGD
jgi:hypothetical protein